MTRKLKRVFKKGNTRNSILNAIIKSSKKPSEREKDLLRNQKKYFPNNETETYGEELPENVSPYVQGAIVKLEVKDKKVTPPAQFIYYDGCGGYMWGIGSERRKFHIEDVIEVLKEVWVNDNLNIKELETCIEYAEMMR